jgi:hypothetical protein
VSGWGVGGVGATEDKNNQPRLSRQSMLNRQRPGLAEAEPIGMREEDKARKYNKTGQDRTRQDTKKTKHDKARQGTETQDKRR